MTQVVVTGMGIISAIGNDLHHNLQSLMQGKSGVRLSRYFESIYADRLPFGEVNASNDDLKKALGLEHQPGYTRTSLLAMKAMAEAVEDAQWSASILSDPDTALISASTVGGMCLTDQLYEDANMRTQGSDYLDAYGCAAHTLQLIERYGMKGFTDTINTACSSSANAIMLGSRLIRSGRVKRAVVGGVDSLAKYTVNGFNALSILSALPSQPFDVNRSGLNLGEAGAYLVLEAAENCSAKKIYGEIAGYGNANDAFHPSAMSEEAVGAIASMEQALDCAGITAREVNYINAHGTGTFNNDQVEFTGIQSVFGDLLPAYNSTKPYTGHTLGAAGAVEAIFSLLCIYHGMIPAGLNVETSLSLEFPPQTVLQQGISLDYVLSNSFGFGGNCSSLLLAKYKGA